MRSYWLGILISKTSDWLILTATVEWSGNLYRKNIVNPLRYSIIELFLLVTYAAIIVGCFNYHWIAGLFGIGILLGIETGRKTAYPVILMIAAGIVIAACFTAAIWLSAPKEFYVLTPQVKLLLQTYAYFMKAVCVLAWGVPIGTLIWFMRAWMSGKKKTVRERKSELEAIIKEKRASIMQ